MTKATDMSVSSLVSRHARLYPQLIAVSHGSKELSFADLDAQSSRIAWLLYNRGVRKGDFVPVLTSRCLLMVVSLLAILKLGAGYVPIDAETWAADRIQSVLDTVYSKLVVTTQETTQEEFCDGKDLVTLEELEQTLSLDETTFNSVALTDPCPDDPAYIIFTSGTSSKPKGVVILNRSLANYVSQKPFNLDVTPGDKAILIFSVGFDACTGVIFSTICNGGHLILSSPSTVLDDMKSCTILPGTPSILTTLQDPSFYPNIKSIFLGGEPPSAELVSMWWSPNRRMFNAYGPTETTISSTISELIPHSPIVLGNPMNGSRVLLLNQNLEEDVEGEICISGPGLAKGYFQNETLTAAKFILWGNGLRIYRTGDFGRLTPSGIVFCGRQDSLVKNRGFLINLDTEVIASLRTFPGIINATALMYKSRLVAFVTPTKLNPLEIRTWLLERYDVFLVPDIIQTMETLPLSANGKVNTSSLREELSYSSFSSDSDVSHKPINILIKVTALALDVPMSGIWPEKSFWALGGNSLSAIKLLSHLHKECLRLSVADLLSSPTLYEAAQLLETIEAEVPVHSNPETIAPMTTVQSSMARKHFQQPIANYMLLSMSGSNSALLKGDILKAAWIMVLKRHSIFCSAFDTLQSVQSVHNDLMVDWEEILVPDNEAMEDFIHIASRDLTSLASRPSEGNNTFRPVNSFRLIKSSIQRFTLLWLVHHIEIDGWSMCIIFEELRAALSGSAGLSFLPSLDFSQFSRQRARYARQIHDKAMQFWSSHVPIHHASRTPFPFEKTKSKGICSLDTSCEKILELGMTLSELEQKCRSMQVSPAAVIYLSWAMILQIYLNEDYAMFGAVLSGRNFPLAKITRVVGPVINTCPFSVDLKASGNAEKDKMLQIVHNMLIQMIDYQWSANEYLESIPGDTNELLSTIVAIEYDLPDIPCPWPSSDDWKYESKTFVDSGLMVLIEQCGEGGMLGTRFQYATGQFETKQLARMQSHFHNIILGLLDLNISSLGQVRDRMLDPVELDKLNLYERPLDCTSYDGPSNLKDAFEEAAEKYPEHIAVEITGQSITYTDLDESAEHLAVHLRGLVKPNDVVATLSDGSLSWLISILAIIKAGAVCAPIDSKLPAKRKAQMITDSEAAVYIILSHKGYDLESIADTHILCLEDLSTRDSDSTRKTRSTTQTEFNDPAFLIFTSGSTGIPKGVKICHGPILSYLNVPEARLHSTVGRKNAQTLSVGFDVCIAEIFGTLCYGATLVLKDPGDPFAHLAKVNATMATPSLLSSLDSGLFVNLDTIFLAGEDVPQALVDEWAVGSRRLYNGYGPCECTIVVLISKLQAEQEVCAGRPVVTGTVCSIRNAKNHRVPIGVPGEICISGPSVARGYINNEADTMERFIEDPLSPGTTLFCTGDIAQWTESMEIKYIGRKDDQVKLRGFRIDLHEVDRAVRLSSPAVRDVAVIVHDENICAFVAPSTVDVDNIQIVLRDLLPYYAQPSAVKALHQIPLSANRKVDRKSLHELAVFTMEEPTGKKLTTSMEKLIERTWKEVLNIDDSIALNSESDFLRLGGNSLKQIKCLQKLSNVLGCTVPFTILVHHFTLSSFAQALEKHYSQSRVQAELPLAESVDGSIGVSYLEEEIYRLHSISTGHALAFNVVCNLRLQGDVNVPALAQSVDLVIAETDILRSRYVVTDGTLKRLVSKNGEPVEIIHSNDIESGSRAVDGRVNTPFNLYRDQLIKPIIVIGGGDLSLVLLLHHIIADKRAVNIILEQTSRNYLNLTTPSPVTATLISGKEGASFSYESWVKRSTNQVPHIEEEEIQRFWQQYLPQSRLPLYSRNSRVGAIKGQSCQWKINHRSRSSKHSSSSTLYLAASALSICDVFGINDIVLGIPYSNRTEKATDEIVGTFLDRLPLRVDCSQSITLEPVNSLLNSIQSNVHAALAHFIPYQQLRSLLGIEDDRELFDVMVIYHHPESSYANSLVLPSIESVIDIPIKPRAALFPLMIEFFDSHSGDLICEINYDSALLGDLQVKALKDALTSALKSDAIVEYKDIA
uniref:Nonribosomal peptide synthetase 5 n=1 Tax=Talaromyces marneffei PM1 TaxID=1077442 RepID=A0A093VLN8_TALMA